MSALCISGDFPTETAQSNMPTAANIAALVGKQLMASFDELLNAHILNLFTTALESFRSAYYERIRIEFAEILKSRELTQNAISEFSSLREKGSQLLALIPGIEKAGVRLESDTEDRITYCLQVLENHQMALEGNILLLDEAAQSA